MKPFYYTHQPSFSRAYSYRGKKAAAKLAARTLSTHALQNRERATQYRNRFTLTTRWGVMRKLGYIPWLSGVEQFLSTFSVLISLITMGSEFYIKDADVYKFFFIALLRAHTVQYISMTLAKQAQTTVSRQRCYLGIFSYVLV
jgi:hypothetical protein